VLDCLDAALADLTRAVVRGGEPALSELGRLGQRYDELWCGGLVDSPDMRALTREFMLWLGQAGGDAWSDYQHRAVECVRKLKGLDLGPEICDLPDCDPDFGVYLGALNRHLADEFWPCGPKTDRPRRYRRPPAEPAPGSHVPGTHGGGSGPAPPRPTRPYGSGPAKGT